MTQVFFRTAPATLGLLNIAIRGAIFVLFLLIPEKNRKLCHVWTYFCAYLLSSKGRVQKIFSFLFFSSIVTRERQHKYTRYPHRQHIRMHGILPINKINPFPIPQTNLQKYLRATASATLGRFPPNKNAALIHKINAVKNGRMCYRWPKAIELTHSCQ